MYLIRFFLLTLISLNVFAHGGDNGPSTLEEEFSKMAHLHLPLNYSTSEGGYLGYEIGKLEDEFTIENHPVAFGGMDKISRATCLAESTPTLIEVCPEDASYMLLENKKWDLGLGLESHIHLPIPGVGFGVGLSYIKGKDYYSYRNLENKNEIRKPLSFPTSYAEFKNWRAGDQLFYMAKGSIVLNVFIGFEPFVHLGPLFSHTGVHRISMKKIDEKTLIAEIGTLKSNDLSLEGNAIILGGELSAGKGKASSASYEFNMEDPRVYPVIASFLVGRLDLVNQSVLEDFGSVIFKSDSKNKGRTSSGGISLPILFMNGGYRGTYSSIGTADEFEEGELHKHDVYSSSKVKDHFTRGVLSDHLWVNKTLVSTIVREQAHPDESILSVVLNWSYSRDHFRHSEFQRKIKKAAKSTGIRSLEFLKLPKEAKGYVKLNVSVNLAAEHVLKVLSKKQKTELENLQKKNDYAGLNKKLLKFMNQFFKDDRDLSEVFQDKMPSIQIGVEGANLKKSVLHI